MFTKSRVEPSTSRQHPLFCPVYVLDQKLQKGQTIEKWMSRARLGIYLGRSPNHAKSIALVLDIKTGRVSPQFHVRFDPSFGTVAKDSGNKVPNSLWQIAAGFKKGKSTLKLDSRAGKDVSPTFVGDSDTPEAMEREPTPSDNGQPNDESPTQDSDNHEDADQPTQDDEREKAPSKPTSQNEEGLRRSTRTRTKPELFQHIYNRLGSTKADIATTKVEGEIFSLESMCPTAMAASSNPDIMYYHEAMKEPDSAQFTEAAVKEYQDILEKGILKMIDQSEVPKDAKIFKSVWAMRRKRRIMSGEV